MCCISHDVEHKNKLIKDSRIYKEMATMMYTNKPLYGSKEEIALIREKAKETGEDVEAEIMRTLEPGIIVVDYETDCSTNIGGDEIDKKTCLHKPMKIIAFKLKIRGSGSFEECFVENTHLAATTVMINFVVGCL